jgi:hypothetical protein
MKEGSFKENPMDRRQSVRKKTPGNVVYLYYRGKRIHRCKTCDISTKGVFIEISPLAVPRGAIVQLVFVIHQGHIIKIHRKSAIITRVSKQGAGLGFLYSGRRAG